jgi:drug/metabolite transporter (DMT)-like permease
MTRTRIAILALTLAGALWGLTVPLSKLSLEWLGGGWLTVLRFILAAPLLAYVGRRGLRAALTPRVAAAGAIGFGLVILLQNAGIERTSVSHAALLVGAVPVMVALLSVTLGHGAGRPLAWAGYAVALGGMALVAGGGGSGATPAGDLLVLGSVALSATFIVVQPKLLAGRDPAAVTAVQFAAGALIALPHAVVFEGLPPAPAETLPVAALGALALAGTLLPFWLFAFGQAHVKPAVAGSFLNLEPLVGAATGWLAFGESATAIQAAGAVAVLAGIGLSTVPRSSSTDTTTPSSPTTPTGSPPGGKAGTSTSRGRAREGSPAASSRRSRERPATRSRLRAGVWPSSRRRSRRSSRPRRSRAPSAA